MAGFRVSRPGASGFSLDPSTKDQKRIKDEAHLAFIRTLPSAVSGKTPCEAAHIRYGDPAYRKKRTGRSQKPDDAWCLPLTTAEHRSQHDTNEREWWRQHHIDPCALARELYAVSGDTEAAIRILRQARLPLAEKPWKPGKGDGD